MLARQAMKATKPFVTTISRFGGSAHGDGHEYGPDEPRLDEPHHSHIHANKDTLKNKEALEKLLAKVPKRNYTAVVDEFMRRLKDETYN